MKPSVPSWPAANRGFFPLCGVVHPPHDLSSELADDNPRARQAVATSFTAWSEAIHGGLSTMIRKGVLRADTDADTLEAALDVVITQIQGHAV